MIEIEIESGRGFGYGTESLKEYPNIKYEVERSEVVNGYFIYTLKIFGEVNADVNFNYQNLGKIYCEHGNEIKYTSANRLPSEGWEELIDCWSCHSNEFKEVLKLKKKVRKGGILVGSFYCIPDSGIMPECCRGHKKLYFDKIKSRFSVNNFIFGFLEEYFTNRNIFVVEGSNGEKYSVKFFYKCVLLKEGKQIIAIKVGVRKSYNDEVKNDDGKEEFINESFRMAMIELLNKNMLSIEALGYKLSFITYY